VKDTPLFNTHYICVYVCISFGQVRGVDHLPVGKGAMFIEVSAEISGVVQPKNTRQVMRNICAVFISYEYT
jgi:hypothetical protein